jgi:predicted nucleic acid-binding protein
MVFVDTGVWFAILFAKDPLHQRARIWFDEVNEELVTSDYIVDETLTLLLMRGEPTKARDFGRQIIVAGGARLAFVSEQQFNRSWLFFQQMASQPGT